MADSNSQKPTRTDIDAPLSGEDAEQASRTPSHQLPGRSFGGTSFASDQQEQTADHRGESRDHLMDDIVSDPVDQIEGLPPRDNS